MEKPSTSPIAAWKDIAFPHMGESTPGPAKLLGSSVPGSDSLLCVPPLPTHRQTPSGTRTGVQHHLLPVPKAREDVSY